MLNATCMRKSSTYFFLAFLCKVQFIVAWRLNQNEVRQIFGTTNSVPEYSVFKPRLYYESEHGRNKRQATNLANVFEFSALGRSYKFRLEPVTNLLDDNFVLIARRSMQSYLLDSPYKNCSFQGTEIHDNSQSIALVMCDKLRGVIMGPGGELVIEPLPERIFKKRRRRRRRSFRAPQGVEDHIVYRRTSHSHTGCSIHDQTSTSQWQERSSLFSRKSESVYNNFYPIGGAASPKDPLRSDLNSFSGKDPFSGRKPELLHIETAVYVDRDLLDHMKKNFPRNTEAEVVKVVLAMVNAVQLLYNDPSLGHKIKYVLKRLELLYHDPPGLVRDHNIDKFLTQFCTWQDRENPKSDSDSLHWDHALILTGLDLFTVEESQKINSQVVGLAPVAGMCTRTSSCTVNEGRHFESVYVVAHEIGHNLGMKHDGLPSGNNCDPNGYLMSPTLGSGKVTWSHCSKRYLDQFLSSSSVSNCLRDTPSPPPEEFDHERSGWLPGRRFSADQQCFLKYGEGSRASPHQPLKDICKDLHCSKVHFTWTSHPALEGTYCGHGKSCRRGYCMDDLSGGHSSSHGQDTFGSTGSSSANLNLEDEGPWGRWSECNSVCLYGMKGFLSGGSTGLSISESQCRSCRKRLRYKACSAARNCNLRTKLTLQDYADDTCRRLSSKNPSLAGYSVRIPPEGIRLCEIECLARSRDIRPVKSYFPDGTVCYSPTDYPTYCINGFCTEFRCEEGAFYDAGPLFCNSKNRPPPGPFPPPLLFPPTEASPSSPSDRFTGLFTTTRIPKSDWGSWVPTSDCRSSCISPAKGIQLVGRTCLSSSCDGLNKNIQLCDAQLSKCNKVETPFEYATFVCQRFKLDVEQLSGFGMQLTSTADDPNRGCIVACQDSDLKYRFYRVNGREGWFPFGTECSPHLNGYRSYCLNGKCLEFSLDGSPVREKSNRRHNRSLQRLEGGSGADFTKLSFEQYTQRLPRIESDHALNYQEAIDVSPDESMFLEPSPSGGARSPEVKFLGRVKRTVKPTSRRIPGSFGEDYLLSLIHEVNTTISRPFEVERVKNSTLDFKNPIFYAVQTSADIQHDVTGGSDDVIGLKSPPRSALHSDPGTKGSHYHWSLKFVECSVTCGRGIKKKVMECRDSIGHIVPSSLCPEIQKDKFTPEQFCFSGLPCVDTTQTDKTSSFVPSLDGVNSSLNSPLGKWLLSSINEIKDNGH